MHNLLILYNPYYQRNVIWQHVRILQVEGRVAFGKVRSKLNDKDQRVELEEIYAGVSESNPLQLFLSDYANLYVAKVVKVSGELGECPIPSYYQEKGLEIDGYFIITDLLELVREDFTVLRDHFLANFTTPHYGGHSYAIYGNSYVYPLLVEQKKEEMYFEEEEKHYLNLYKNKLYLDTQNNLMRFVFGKRLFYLLHPNSVANLVSAELELMQYGSDPLYDFTSVVVKYSKVLEYELYDFARVLLREACKKDDKILRITYTVQGLTYTIQDFLKRKPNMGTIKHLLQHERVTRCISAQHITFINKELSEHIKILQNIRNRAVHFKSPHAEVVYRLRDRVLGIESVSMLKSLLLQKEGREEDKESNDESEYQL